MPRPVRAQGRPGTSVIPADWADSHRPVIAKTLGATIAFRHPGGTTGPLDPDTDQPTYVPNPPYQTGKCRIQVLARADQQKTDVADQPVQKVGYLVVVDTTDEDLAHPITVDDLGDITAVDANGDPTLVGRTLVVDSIARGSIVWERDIYCTDVLDHPQEG